MYNNTQDINNPTASIYIRNTVTFNTAYHSKSELFTGQNMTQVQVQRGLTPQIGWVLQKL